MQLSLDFEVDPFNVAATFPQMIYEWREEVAMTFKDWGIELTQIAKELSPSDKIRDKDSSRKKGRRPESESFKNFWYFEVGFDGIDPQLSIGNSDEKMPYIVFPTTGGSVIAPKESSYLVFYWFARGGWFRPFTVERGDTPGQPVHEWTIKEFNIDQHLSDLVR